MVLLRIQSFITSSFNTQDGSLHASVSDAMGHGEDRESLNTEQHDRNQGHDD